MSGINNIQFNTATTQTPPSESLNSAPGVRAGRSVGHIIGRVVLGVLTLGISEGIRAIVRHARAARPSETPAPRLAQNAQPAQSAQRQPAAQPAQASQAQLPARPAPQFPAELLPRLEDARQMLGWGVALDEIMANMADLAPEHAVLMRRELEHPGSTRAPFSMPGIQATAAGPDFTIRSRDDLIALIRDLAHAQLGQSAPAGQYTASDGTPATLYHYSGVVFRSDTRNFAHIIDEGGLHSYNDLNDPENLIEALGLAFDRGAGATGRSGASTAKLLSGAIPYYVSGGLYIIDTRQLGPGQLACDLGPTVDSTGRQADGSGEVNATDIPNKAIMGCIQLTGDALWDVSDIADSNAKIARLLLHIEANPEFVQFNPFYQPL